MRILHFAPLFFAVSLVQAGELLPTTRGTSWTYDATEEDGANASRHSVVTRRFDGTEEANGRQLFKLQTFTDGKLSLTELVAVDKEGVRSAATHDGDGNVKSLPAPVVVVPKNLATGVTWKVEGEVRGVAMHQSWRILGTEDVAVPAGTFTAFRFQGEQTMPAAIVSDRWFIPGIGFIKEVTTMRGPGGDLLGRRTLELRSLPRVAAAPTPAANSKLVVGVSSRPIGAFETEISPEAPNLYARWEGTGLRDKAKIRAVWIAENVGDIAPPNYQIDDATTITSSADAHGLFTLTRPPSGWAEGKYRVEFYLDGALVQSVPLRIRSRESPSATPFNLHSEVP